MLKRPGLTLAEVASTSKGQRLPSLIVECRALQHWLLTLLHFPDCRASYGCFTVGANVNSKGILCIFLINPQRFLPVQLPFFLHDLSVRSAEASCFPFMN